MNWSESSYSSQPIKHIPEVSILEQHSFSFPSQARVAVCISWEERVMFLHWLSEESGTLGDHPAHYNHFHLLYFAQIFIMKQIRHQQELFVHSDFTTSFLTQHFKINLRPPPFSLPSNHRKDFILKNHFNDVRKKTKGNNLRLWKYSIFLS